MCEHGRSLIGTMMKERHNAGVIKILVGDMIANLDSEMTGTHAARQFLAGSIDVLQRNLT